jgi:hypothetical protein
MSTQCEGTARFVIDLADSDSVSNEPMPACGKCLVAGLVEHFKDEPTAVFAVQDISVLTRKAEAR